MSQKQPRWLLDRPVKPGDDTHGEAVVLRYLLRLAGPAAPTLQRRQRLLRRGQIVALESLSDLVHGLREWPVGICKALELAKPRIGLLCAGQVAGIERVYERDERLPTTATYFKTAAVINRSSRSALPAGSAASRLDGSNFFGGAV